MKQDLCCWACRTPYGCRNARCEHHREFEKQDEANAKARRTHRDPTADQAVYGADRSRKGKAR